MHAYKLNEPVFTDAMNAEAEKMLDYLRYTYEEDKERIGKRVNIEYEFEEYYTPKSHIREDGEKWFTNERDTTIPPFYECVLYISVPVYRIGKVIEEHRYRWNAKHNTFDYEALEIK